MVTGPRRDTGPRDTADPSAARARPDRRGAEVAAAGPPRPGQRRAQVAAARPPRPGLRHAEDGFVAGSEALILGVLVFLVGTLVLLNVWAVIDGRFVAAAAAREATRAAVQAAPQDDVAATAQAAALAALQAHGTDPSRVQLTVTATSAPVRCGEVRADVAVDVPLSVVPWIGADRPGVTVRASHAEVVDPYRSGLPAGVDCGF